MASQRSWDHHLDHMSTILQGCMVTQDPFIYGYKQLHYSTKYFDLNGDLK